ncbi:MAG: hypothetical protein JSR99_08210 [Proteobacteria bacterium]|nr:hypothetical protein [Pseudomonadota bacterium]
MTPTTKGRALAIIAGCAFAAGGLTILLDKELLKPLLWTSAHWLTILMVFGTIAAGHLMVDATRARHLFSTLGFLALFLSGTGLVVYSSVGRQVEAQGTTTLSVEDLNKKIVEKSADLEAAKARRDYAEQQVQATMTKSYCGRGCKDWKLNAKDVSVVISQLETEIAALGPQKPVNAQAAAMADVLLLFHVPGSKEQIVSALTLLIPFSKTIFFEIGSIVSLGFAFRPAPISIAKPASDLTGQSDYSIAGANDFQALKASISGELPDPTPPRGGRKSRKSLPANVVPLIVKHPVVAALENNGGSVASNRELADLMSVSPGEASKRSQEIEHLLEVRWAGKEKRIALRRSA